MLPLPPKLQRLTKLPEPLSQNEEENKMKTYVNPEMMLIDLANEDILTLSGGENGSSSNVKYDEFFPNKSQED